MRCYDMAKKKIAKKGHMYGIPGDYPASDVAVTKRKSAAKKKAAPKKKKGGSSYKW
jgi:hypothetical protein